MEFAKCRVGNLGWRIVHISEIKSGDVSKKDIAGHILCPYCNAEGWFKQGAQLEWHFAFAHQEDCEVILNSGNKHKSYKIITGEVVREDDMMNKNIYRKKSKNYKDSDEIDEADFLDFENNKSNDEITYDVDDYLPDIDYESQRQFESSKQYIDDIDMVRVYREKNIYRPLGLYRLILKVGIHEPIFADGRCGDDILLDDIHLMKIRAEGMEESRRLAIVKRTGTKILKYPFKIPNGYVLLRDIYATNSENAIYFLVKITNDELNKVFQRELMGDKSNREKTRNQHQDLLIYHNWYRYPNDYYQIYIAQIGNCAYSFVNMAHDKKKHTY